MSTTELDPGKAEAFAMRMGGLVNDALLSLSVSLAHQAGLFDTMAALPPSTSHEIAAAAGLQERYVRENLAALVVGGIVTYDPAGKTYVLPPEHAAVTTRAAGVNNLAALTQFVAMVGLVEQDVLRCFREGGGVPYSKYPTFHRIIDEGNRDAIDATLLTTTLDLMPGVRERLESGIDVADIGCGSGYALNVLGRAFPKSTFIGFDFSEEAIGVGTALATEWGLDNVRFEVRDVTDLGIVDGFDLITTFDAVHDQAKPAAVLAGIAAALRPGGTYLCVDIQASSNLEDNLDHPLGPALYTLSCMHCMTVSLALDGEGLGTCWGEQVAHRMLAEAGFTDVRTETVEGDIFNVYYIATAD